MLKNILLLTFALLIFNKAHTQSDKVIIEIPGKSDLIYNGKSLQILDPNLVIGVDAGPNLNQSSQDNTLIGKTAGKTLTSGRGNTFLGNNAGFANDGSLNVFLGNGAGFNETGDEKLYIANSTTSSPLIFGDFRNKTLTINDYLNISQDLHVSGSGEMQLLTLSSANPSLNLNLGLHFHLRFNIMQPMINLNYLRLAFQEMHFPLRMELSPYLNMQGLKKLQFM